MPLLTVDAVRKLYGADLVLSGATFQLERGEHVALVGANGSGKSTLLRIIAGLDSLDSGQVSLARNAIVTYVSQHARFESGHSLFQALLDTFRDSIDAQKRMREIESQIDPGGPDLHLSPEYQRLSVIVEHAGYDYESRIERVLTGLELEREHWDKPVSVLSGGQRTRANLARALLKESDLLLLDEPTNHLDVAAIEWLEGYLKSQKRAFIVVAHDRYFLQNVTRRTLELVRGKIEDYPAPYMQFLQLREERRERSQRMYESQREEIAVTEEFVRRFGAGQRSKEAKGRQKRLDRVERLERPPEEQGLTLRLDKAKRKGDVAVRLDSLAAGYGGKEIVQAPKELSVPHGARVAIVGPNGSGKTTLARTLIDQLDPVRGSVQWTSGLTPAYYAQSSAALFSPDQTVLQAFEDRFPSGEEVARTYLGRFLFSGDEVYKLVGDLSGGERSRLALACLLYSHPTVLLLDEPTNHLDIPAREALQNALTGFGGTLLLISHDRFLIDQLATEIWALHDGRIEVYDGNWSDYIAGRHKRRVTYAEAPDVDAQLEATPQTAHAVRRRGMFAILDDLRELQSEVEPVLARLESASPGAAIDQLQTLSLQYEELQSRLLELTEELVASSARG